MPTLRKYDDETRARAVHMYQDRLTEGGVSKATIHREIGEFLGMKPEIIRGWVKQQLGDGSTPPAVGVVAAEPGRKLVQ